MYTAAAIIALAISLSAPALAAPVSGSHPEHHGHHGRVRHQQAHPAHRHHHGTAHHPTRELDLLTREPSFEARSPFNRPIVNHIFTPPSLHLNDNIFGDLFSGGSNSQQQQKQRRDLEDLLVREFVLAARDADESGASIISTIIRAIPKVVSGLSDLFGGGSNSQPQQQPQPVPTSQPLPQATTQAKREMIEDLIMRELFAPAARSLYELD